MSARGHPPRRARLPDRVAGLGHVDVVPARSRVDHSVDVPRRPWNGIEAARDLLPAPNPDRHQVFIRQAGKISVPNKEHAYALIGNTQRLILLVSQ